MIRALDLRLIAAAQWLVDLTQRQPAWLARQCAILGVLATLVRWGVFDTGSPWAAGLLVLAFLLMAGVTYLPEVFHSHSVVDLPIRITLALWLCFEGALLLLALALSAPPDIVGRLPISMLEDLALATLYYLAACKPPRPRVPRPRGRLVPGGAA